MKLLAVGGGSGGHVTPVVAVVNEVSKLQDNLEVTFVCDKAFELQSRGLMEHAFVPVTVRTIAAGKFRRYAHLSMARQLIMPRIVWANFIDLFKVVAGFVQSIAIIVRHKPDVVFAKGGFVCLPLGLAAKFLRIPIVIHDSDVRPGLTNRFLAKWAVAIATGSPVENYNYNAQITTYTGVPIAAAFAPYSTAKQKKAKAALGFDPEKPLIVATGGGLGARSINEAMVRSAAELISAGISVYHVTGKAHYVDVAVEAQTMEGYTVTPFVFEGMADVLGAADVVVSRASATFLQELAGLGKPTVAIPARSLGDQLKNAKAFADADAIVSMTDAEISDGDALAQALIELVKDTKRRQHIATNLRSFARPHAARDVAQMVVDARKAR